MVKLTVGYTDEKRPNAIIWLEHEEDMRWLVDLLLSTPGIVAVGIFRNSKAKINYGGCCD